ncbi:MAG: ComEC/Rec2 family competence protein [Bacteroidales bacterium]|nr:ComEC/Rec2 family competence protein [Bacteroidales bacterium]
MKNFCGIEAISLCFVAGVALAAWLEPDMESCYLLCAPGVLACTALTLLLPAVPPRSRLPFLVIPSAFLLAGFVHYCGVSAVGEPALPRPGGAERLRRAIYGCGLEGAETPALLAALLTGDRSGLSRSTVAAFRASGAAHILALSGLHLGVLYVVISKICGTLGRSRAAGVVRSVLCSGACLWYALATGASPSIIRAFLFISLRETSSHFPERSAGPLSIYCTSMFLQILATPSVIRSAAFELSYLAVLGIITVYPRLDSWYDALGKARGPLRRIWSIAALSISCQLFTAPLSWALFGNFPVHFLITNLIALPLTEALTVTALLLLTLSALPIQAGAVHEVLTKAVDLLAAALLDAIKVIASE